MSIYDKASLVLIPSGTKTSKVYSQKPTNGDGDFTFSRSTAATRVNASGNIEKETSNLLLQSNTFSTTWTNNNSTETGGQSGYDGSNDAWLLNSVGSGSAYVAQSVSSSGVKTLSIYAKAGTADWVIVQLAGGTASYAWFDLTNGLIGTEVNVFESKIESVSGGWYRCSITGANSNTSVNIYVATANNSVSTSSGDNIYIQDAQLEQGLVARDYIETTTTAIYGGITDNVPRLDYTDSSCPALLLEPQRTNVFDYSEYASGNSSANAPTLVENYAVSPEGYQNAFQISTDAGTFRRVRKILTGLSGNTSYSMSIFVKKATSAISTYGGLGMVWQGGTQKVNYIIFDEYNGTMSILQDQTGNTSTKVDDVGDYWRFSVSATDTGSNTSFEAAYYACLSATGSTIGVGVKTWVGYGFQVEAGSYATSYIPTYGSAVTRNAETNELLDMQTNSVTTSGAWTAFLDLSNEPDGAYDNDNSSFFYTYSGNKLNAIISARKYYGTYGEGNVRWYSNADSSTIGYRNSTNKKWVLICDGTNVKLYTDGALSYTYTATNSHNGLQSVQLLYGESNRTTTAYSKFLIFPTAITNQEAIDLTTL